MSEWSLVAPVRTDSSRSHDNAKYHRLTKNRKDDSRLTLSWVWSDIRQLALVSFNFLIRELDEFFIQ
jgi:hypothetical protein